MTCYTVAQLHDTGVRALVSRYQQMFAYVDVRNCNWMKRNNEGGVASVGMRRHT